MDLRRRGVRELLLSCDVIPTLLRMLKVIGIGRSREKVPVFYLTQASPIPSPMPGSKTRLAELELVIEVPGPQTFPEHNSACYGAIEK